MRVGAYPGSFDPPTVAHLAVADAARRQCGLDRLDLVVSTVALGKGAPQRPCLDHRVGMLRTLAERHPWLDVVVTEARLLADIGAGYDLVVMGADKWAQVVDPTWYGGSPAARDAALARLPDVAVAPRAGEILPERDPLAARPGTGMTDRLAGTVRALEVAPSHHPVSSTAVRSGRREWMLPEAAAFDAASGAWSDPTRYARWCTGRPATGIS